MGHRALAARPVTIAIFWRLVADRASGASTVPLAAGWPLTIAQIAAVDAVPGELGREPLMGAVGLGRDDQAGGILVDAVDDAGPGDAADPRQAAAAMVEQGVDQRAVEIARRRVDDEPGGLVDHDQMLVLVDDGERDVLRLVMRRRRVGMVIAQIAPRLARAAGSRATTPPRSRRRRRSARLIRSRERVGAAAASARSSRHPAASGGITARRIDTPVSMD